ncbi:MAG: aspartate dehydrogenase domain-containing protein [Acidimicrobiales bacterium]
MIAVGIIGHGAIGSVVAAALDRGDVSGCRLAGVLGWSRRPDAVTAIDELVAHSQVVVEAAGAEALATYGPTVVAGGVDLLVLSVGALADDDLRRRLLTEGRERSDTGGTTPGLPHGGRMLLSAGAIGGLGLLRAAALLGPIHHAGLTTTKPPSALERPWMSPSDRARLREATGPLTVFSGPARDAVTRFPESANVSATLALATVGFDATHVELVAQPGATLVRHRIEVDAAAGHYTFEIENRPSANLRTSAITPYAVIRALGDLSASVVIGA